MAKFLTLEEAAERLGVEYKTVYRLVRQGDIPAGKVGRIYRIRGEDLDGYFERQKRLLAEQTQRRLVPAEGLACGACEKPIRSELSIGGACEECGREICQACRAIRKARRCKEHAAAEPAEPKPARDPTAPSPSRKTGPGPTGKAGDQRDIAAEVDHLRRQGLPVVTAEEAKVSEGAFVRAFAQRLENVEELPDPLSERTVPLRKARVRHVLEPAADEAAQGPSNLSSTFTLRAGGWGRPKAAVALEARFLSRLSCFAEDGYDAKPLGQGELNLALDALREAAGKQDCFRVALIGSPTGWDEAAVKMVTDPGHGQAFHDRRLGIGLYDLHGDRAYLDEKDKRLWAFWALLTPSKYAGEVSRCAGTLRELVAKYEFVPLDFALERCEADPTWLKAAMRELKQPGKFRLEERSDTEWVLSRAPR